VKTVPRAPEAGRGTPDAEVAALTRHDRRRARLSGGHLTTAPFRRYAEIDVWSFVDEISILRGLARSLTGMTTDRTPLS
jgi:hypothetical protein